MLNKHPIKTHLLTRINYFIAQRNCVIELFNRFESLSLAENPDQDELWGATNNSLHTAVTEILAYNKPPNDQWLSDRTWNLVR